MVELTFEREMPMDLVTAPNIELTPEDVLNLDDEVRFELVDGRLLESEISLRSQFVATQISRLLGNFCETTGFAYIFSETGIICFPGHPNRMRRPDVLCIRADRLTSDQLDNGFLNTYPDLAIEVISPNDKVYELEKKLDDYRLAGIPLVWLVYPPSKRVRIIRLEGPTTELGPDDVLTGEDVLPGFRCPVSDLFAGPEPSTSGPAR